MSHVDQQLIALEVAVKQDDLSMITTIVKQLHFCRESERGKIIW